MSRVYVGRITSFHGVKGEVRIKSDFLYPKKAFLVDSFLIIDEKRYKIVSYRVHKDYHMVKFLGFDTLDDVLFLKNKDVYKEKCELNLLDSEILDSDLVDYGVATTSGEVGSIVEVFYASKSNKILRVLINNREILIPMNSPYIKNIDPKKREVLIEVIEGM